MTLKELIKQTSKECASAAETCLEVGDPIFDDLFVDILTQFAGKVEKGVQSL